MSQYAPVSLLETYVHLIAISCSCSGLGGRKCARLTMCSCLLLDYVSVTYIQVYCSREETSVPPNKVCHWLFIKLEALSLALLTSSLTFTICPGLV